jgi:hypothetical protein
MKKHCDEAELMYSGALMAEALGHDDEAVELRLIGNVFQEAHEQEELLFDGKDVCTEDEAEIIFSDLSFEEKMARLQLLRTPNVPPKKFGRIIVLDDKVRAKALSPARDR